MINMSTKVALARYHNFMILNESGFHKVIYKRVRFLLLRAPKIFKISMSGMGINIFFKKIKSVLLMLVLKNLRTVGYPLLVLTK